MDNGLQDCTPYKYNNINYNNAYADDADYISTFWCNTPIYKPKKNLNKTCNNNNKYKSNFYINNICYEKSCSNPYKQYNIIASKKNCIPHNNNNDPELNYNKY